MFFRLLWLVLLSNILVEFAVADEDACQALITSKDYRKAYQTCILQARAGVLSAQYHSATLYEAGLGTKKSDTKATFWYKEAAEKGHVNAMNKLGLAYLEGLGIAKDNQQAWLWLSKAQKLGDPYAYKNRVKMCVLHQVKDVYCDSADVKWKISVMYRKGTPPFKKNSVQEFQYVLQAAQLGHAAAMGQVGFLYDIGRGVKQDYHQAAAWYKKALSKKNFSVANRLGGLYDEGLGVERNTGAAFQYHKGAADRGSVSGMFDLAWCYHYGNGIKRDVKKAADWYQKAAAAGSKDARNGLRTLQEGETNSPELFGLKLSIVEQADMRKAVQKAGGIVIQEDDSQFWNDIYDSTEVLKDSDQLRISYVDESKHLASVEYRFPRLKHGGIENIKEMLVIKYGAAQVTVGDVKKGAVKYGWKVGMIDIVLNRVEPSLVVYLSFSHPMYSRIMQREMSYERKMQIKEQYQRQSQAF